MYCNILLNESIFILRALAKFELAIKRERYEGRIIIMRLRWIAVAVCCCHS